MTQVRFTLRLGPEPPQRRCPHPHLTYHIRYHAYEDHDREHQIRLIPSSWISMVFF